MLYFTFLDLKKAFNNVNRVLLKKKSLKDDPLPPCFTRLVLNMYFETNAIVRAPGSGLSWPFKIKKGVKQGSSLSFFGLLINDMVEFLGKNWA